LDLLGCLGLKSLDMPKELTETGVKLNVREGLGIKTDTLAKVEQWQHSRRVARYTCYIMM
jgi:hypothetical protein